MYVHTGGKYHVHAILQYLVSHRPAYAFHKLRVPGAGQRSAHGKTGGIVAFLVVGACHYDRTRGSVGQCRGRNAEARDTLRVARHAGGEEAHKLLGIVVSAKGVVIASHYKESLLLRSHSFYNLVDVVCPKFQFLGGKRRTAKEDAYTCRQRFHSHGVFRVNYNQIAILGRNSLKRVQYSSEGVYYLTKRAISQSY